MTRKARKQRLHRRPINVLASALTTFNVYCGIASVFAAMAGNHDKAAYLILVAIVFDMMDGSIARLTKSTSEFGKQLDSLADIISFGAAPAVLIYTAYLQAGGSDDPALVTRTGAFFAIVYVIAGALRLARYNVYQSSRRDLFFGLPIPGAGGAIASFVLFTYYFNLDVAFWVLGPLTIGLAFLMVSTIRYPKDIMRLLIFAPRKAFRLLVLCVFAIPLVHLASEHHPAIVLFPVVGAYVLYGAAAEFYSYLRRRAGGLERAESSELPKPEDRDAGSRPEETAPSKIGEFL